MMVFHTPADKYFTDIIVDGVSIGYIEHFKGTDSEVKFYNVHLQVKSDGFIREVLLNKKCMSLSGACCYVRDGFEEIMKRYNLVGVLA